MVEYGADALKEGWGEFKNNLTWLQNLPISVMLEETFLDGCLKSMTTCHHVQNQSRRKRRRDTHGFLLGRQPPACQGILEATTDRSGWTQCQAEKTGKKHRADNVGKATKEKKSKPS